MVFSWHSVFRTSVKTASAITAHKKFFLNKIIPIILYIYVNRIFIISFVNVEVKSTSRLHTVWSRLLHLQLICLIVARDPWPSCVLLPRHCIFFVSFRVMEIIRSNSVFEQGRLARGLTLEN